MSAGKRLVVLLDGVSMGTLDEQHGRHTFAYHSEYRASLAATPLSLSMPLSADSYEDRRVDAFLSGLLPDNDLVLRRWAQAFQVSAGNPFALLAHIGADCPGAVQFVAPAAIADLTSGVGDISWIDEAEMAHRLRTLRRDPAAWHLAGTGQFSLAGAQAKTALYFDPRSGRWGDPHGSIPTTHIIKPAVVGLDEHDLNEHLCLAAAKNLGMDVASSEIVAFENERAICITRYDRIREPDGTLRRIHQEDMCQALGLPPTSKYQNEGGPSALAIVELLRAQANEPTPGDDPVARFVDALAYNWIIAGTDAHAKNYSILLSGPQVRLAPLYDVASALPYDDLYLPKLTLAMSIGGEYRLGGIVARHWRRFATMIGFDDDRLLDRIAELAAAVPDAFATAAQSPEVAAIGSGLPTRLVDRVAQRARLCATALRRE